MDWVDQIMDIDGDKVALRKKFPASYESVEGYNNISSVIYSYSFYILIFRALLLDPLSSNQTFLSSPAQPTNSSISQTNSSQNPPEPNIDLELDIKVFINSGKCVLHTKDSITVKDEDVKT